MRLALKLGLLSASVSAVIIAAVLPVLTATHRSDLLEAEGKRLGLSAEVLNTAVRSVMLSGEAPIAAKILSSLKEIPGLEEADLYKTDGTAAFTDYATLELVNSRQSGIRFSRTPRRAVPGADNPAAFKTAAASETPRTVLNPETKKIDYYHPILNFVECRQCHGDAPFVRGVLRLSLSTSESEEAEILFIRRTGTALFFSLFLLSSAFLVFLRRWVLVPLRGVVQAIKLLGEGDVPAGSTAFDEIGDAARTAVEAAKKIRSTLREKINQKSAETALRERRILLGCVKEPALVVGNDRLVEAFSPAAAEFFGPENLEGKDLLDLFHPDRRADGERQALKKALDRASSLPETEFAPIRLSFDGRIFSAETRPLSKGGPHAASLVTLKEIPPAPSQPAEKPRSETEDETGFLEALETMTADISFQLGKEAEFRVDLGETVFPKALEDSLIRLVRNGLDHGIEPPDERIEKGKPAKGTLLLTATVKADGSTAFILSDDGRGLDFAALERRAKEAGLVPAGQRSVPKTKLAVLLFIPGLGRREPFKSGLAEVYSSVRSLGGRVSIASNRGKGVRVSLSLKAEGPCAEKKP